MREEPNDFSEDERIHEWEDDGTDCGPARVWVVERRPRCMAGPLIMVAWELAHPCAFGSSTDAEVAEVQWNMRLSQAGHEGDITRVRQLRIV